MAVLLLCDCEPNEWGRGAADLYGGNENIRFEGCVFRQMTSGASGGIWVRNWTDRVESRNIRFQNCEFYKSGADELLAVWGWGGAVRNVVLSGCSFYETQTQEGLDRRSSPGVVHHAGAERHHRRPDGGLHRPCGALRDHFPYGRR